MGGVTEIIDAFRPIVDEKNIIVYDDPELNGVPLDANYTTFTEGKIHELMN